MSKSRGARENFIIVFVSLLLITSAALGTSQEDTGSQDEGNVTASEPQNEGSDVGDDVGTTEENETVVTLTLATDTVPSGTIAYGDSLDFSFTLEYDGSESVECAFSIQNASGTVYDDTVSESSSTTVSWDVDEDFGPGAYDWELHCVDETDENIEDSESGSFSVDAPLLAEPTFDFTVTETTIDEGDDVGFTVTMSASENLLFLYELDFGDGSDELFGNPSIASSSEQYVHTYDEAGTYTATIDVTLGDDTFEESISITVESVDTADTTGPTVTLIEPASNEIIYSTEADFYYNVTDDEGIANCTYGLYYYNKTPLGTLVYTSVDTSITSGDEIVVELVEFDEGDYSWDVTCYDVSGNERSRSRDFTIANASSLPATQATGAVSTLVDDSSDPTVIAIDELITRVNDFLTAEANLGVDELAVLDAIGLSDELRLHKKRLLQMKRDVQHNIDFIRGEEKREERLNEILDEVAQLDEVIPGSIAVSGSYEYQKNTVSLDFATVVDSYADAQGLVLDKRTRSSLISYNEMLQEQLKVKSKAYSVTLTYPDREDSFVLVVKELVYDEDASFTQLIEVVTEDLAGTADVSFEHDAQVLGDDYMYAIDIDSVEANRLVYTVSATRALEDFEGTDTLAFSELVREDQSFGGSLTGFVSAVQVGSGGFFMYFSWLLVLVGGLVVGTYSYRKVQLTRLKRDSPELQHMYDVIHETEEALQDKEVQIARDKYHEASALYPALPENSKKAVYARIQRLLQQIDKQDAIALIKEFIIASKAGNRNYALTLYADITALYTRLPKRFREKAYAKMRPHIRSLRG